MADVELGTILQNPGRAQYPAATELLEPFRRTEARYSQCGPNEEIRMTAGGWARVDKNVWSMSSNDAKKLEPAFSTVLMEMAIAMMPGTWPDFVRNLVEEAIFSMDLRLSVSHQKIYRDLIYGAIRRNERPNIPAIWACMCSMRSNKRLRNQLELTLRPQGMDFWVDILRLDFLRTVNVLPIEIHGTSRTATDGGSRFPTLTWDHLPPRFDGSHRGCHQFISFTTMNILQLLNPT